MKALSQPTPSADRVLLRLERLFALGPETHANRLKQEITAHAGQASWPQRPAQCGSRRAQAG